MTDDYGPLATFSDRWTMRHQRTYQHPIERVWEAVTTSEHLDAWMMPHCKVDPVQGGRFGFSFGGPANQLMEGVVAELRPPGGGESAAVDYLFDNGGRLRFQLDAVAGGTRLRFVQSFPTGTPGEPMEGPGGDLPAGPDTPWRPGFVGGYHAALDALGQWLDGALTAEETRAALDRHLRGEFAEDWLRGIEIYRAHIAATCPPASPLATFDSRLTMRHVRFYAHPLERVWQAVTTPAELDLWLLPVCTVEPRLGGRATFTWGGPDKPAQEHTIVEFDPPRVVDYQAKEASLRFELEPVEGGTRLVLIHSFAPGQTFEPADRPGGDLPAGPGSPWMPDFSQGFHVMLDQLRRYLDGEWTAPVAAASVDRHLRGFPDAADDRMIGIYRRHIREHCPPGGAL